MRSSGKGGGSCGALGACSEDALSGIEASGGSLTAAVVVRAEETGREGRGEVT